MDDTVTQYRRQLQTTRSTSGFIGGSVGFWPLAMQLCNATALGSSRRSTSSRRPCRHCHRLSWRGGRRAGQMSATRLNVTTLELIASSAAPGFVRGHVARRRNASDAKPCCSKRQRGVYVSSNANFLGATFGKHVSRHLEGRRSRPRREALLQTLLLVFLLVTHQWTLAHTHGRP